jgi:archaellin
VVEREVSFTITVAPEMGALLPSSFTVPETLNVVGDGGAGAFTVSRAVPVTL